MCGFDIIQSANCFRRSAICNCSQSRFIMCAWLWWLNVWNSVWRHFAARPGDFLYLQQSKIHKDLLDVSNHIFCFIREYLNSFQIWKMIVCGVKLLSKCLIPCVNRSLSHSGVGEPPRNLARMNRMKQASRHRWRWLVQLVPSDLNRLSGHQIRLEIQHANHHKI
jgi:hypothetical protein